MKLCQMQDIGGCRAVLKSVREVLSLMDFYKRSQTKNQLVTLDIILLAQNRQDTEGYIYLSIL
jgi:hypothetical protein